MSEDKTDGKHLYRQRMHFTPHGTEVRTELTEEGRKRQQEAERASQAQTTSEQNFEKRKLQTIFNEHVRKNDRIRDRGR